MKNIKFELEVQKEMEKDKLAEVLDIINSEIVINVGRKNQISEQILYCRQKMLEEYRDDEDNVAEYFDHEGFVKEESFKVIDRKLKELNILNETPYFGRVDFKDAGYEDEIFIKTTLYKTSSKYTEELNKYIKDLNQDYFKYQDIALEDKVAIGKGEIEKLFNETYKSIPLFRRNRKIKRIIFSRIKDVRDKKVRLYYSTKFICF